MKLKRIIALLLVIIIFASISAWADTSAEILVANETDGKVTISGTTVQFAGTEVVLRVFVPRKTFEDVGESYAGTDTIIFTTVATVGAAKTYSAVFDLKSDALGGRYNVYASIPGLSGPVATSFDFVNPVAVTAVANAVAGGNWSAVRTALETNRNIDSINPDAGTDYSDYEHEEQRDYVAKQLVEKINYVANKEQLESVLTATTDLINKTNTISTGTYSVIKELIENNAAGFDIQLTAYNSLSTSKKEKVIDSVKIVAANFVLPGDVKKAFDNAVTEAAKATTPGSSPSGGGGGRPSVKDEYGISGGFLTEISGNKNKDTLAASPLFKDIESVPWAKNAINILAEKGIINGKSATEFCPNDTITREEMVKLIVTGFDPDVISAKALAFKDVKLDEWYYDSIAIAHQAKIVSGMSNEHFGVGENITRQDMAKMILSAMVYNRLSFDEQLLNSEAKKFKDSEHIADYAKEAVEMLTKAGVIDGYDDGTFAPNATATRAEAAQILYKVLYCFNLI